MRRRQAPHPSRPVADQSDAPTRAPTNEWTRWRPRPKPVLLGLSVILLVAWVGFLFAMISLK